MAGSLVFVSVAVVCVWNWYSCSYLHEMWEVVYRGISMLGAHVGAREGEISLSPSMLRYLWYRMLSRLVLRLMDQRDVEWSSDIEVMRGLIQNTTVGW